MFTHEMIKSFNQWEMDVYNYIISNEEKVVYMKVRELAEAVHVSTTTILRSVSYTHLFRACQDQTSKTSFISISKMCIRDRS